MSSRSNTKVKSNENVIKKVKSLLENIYDIMNGLNTNNDDKTNTHNKLLGNIKLFKSNQEITKDIFVDHFCSIFDLLNVEYSTMVLALIYLDKISLKIKISMSLLKRIFTVCIILAAKYNEDMIYSYKIISKIIGLKISSLSSMENYIAEDIMNYDFYVYNELYLEYDRLILA